jgi:hypothetical protein
MLGACCARHECLARCPACPAASPALASLGQAAGAISALIAAGLAAVRHHALGPQPVFPPFLPTICSLCFID